MQKVYLLLRNNRRTGPYSLDEILQLHLKPFDLVWVEGRSAAWRYPGEIDALKPYVPETPRSELPFQPIATATMEGQVVQQVPQPVAQVPAPIKTSAKIFVSFPGKSTAPVQQPEDRKASQPAPIRAPQDETRTAPPQETTEELHTNLNRSLQDVEQDYTNWVYQKKTAKKKSFGKKDVAVALLIVALITMGYFIFSEPSMITPQQESAMVNPKVPVEENTIIPQEEENISRPAGEEKKFTADEKPAIKDPASPSRQQKKPIQQSPSYTPPPIENHEAANNEVVLTEEKAEAPQKETADPVAKKKKLGQVLKDIFAKKDKKGDVTEAEPPRPATNRQSTKKSDEHPEADVSMMMEMVDVTASQPDNWMMGISGVRATLRNHNHTALSAASVVVSYMNENNQLIEKKLLQFHNIPAKGKAILAVPEHKFADHIELKLTSITPREDRYAQF